MRLSTHCLFIFRDLVYTPVVHSWRALSMYVIKYRNKPKHNRRQHTHQNELISKSVNMIDRDFFCSNAI